MDIPDEIIDKLSRIPDGELDTLLNRIFRRKGITQDSPRSETFPERLSDKEGRTRAEMSIRRRRVAARSKAKP